MRNAGLIVVLCFMAFCLLLAWWAGGEEQRTARRERREERRDRRDKQAAQSLQDLQTLEDARTNFQLLRRSVIMMERLLALDADLAILPENHRRSMEGIVAQFYRDQLGGGDTGR